MKEFYAWLEDDPDERPPIEIRFQGLKVPASESDREYDEAVQDSIQELVAYLETETSDFFLEHLAVTILDRYIKRTKA